MTIISSAEDYISLVDRGDAESQEQLRSAQATEAVWKEIILEHPDYRLAVSLIKSLPESILRLLATDHDPIIRSTVAMKRALSPDIFMLLAADSDESVRARIACNKKVSNEILMQLISDSSQIVAEPARKQISERTAQS